MVQIVFCVKWLNRGLLTTLFSISTPLALAKDLNLADKPVPSHVCKGSLSTSNGWAEIFGNVRHPVDFVRLIKDRLDSGILCTDPEHFAKQAKLSGVQWRIAGLPKATGHMWFGDRELQTPPISADLANYLKLLAWYGDYPGSISWFFLGNTLYETTNPDLAKLFRLDELDLLLGQSHQIYEMHLEIFGKPPRRDRTAIWHIGDKYMFAANYTIDGEIYLFEFHTNPEERLRFLDRDPHLKRIGS